VPAADPTLEISGGRGQSVTVTLPRAAGIHRYKWDLRFAQPELTEVQRQAISQRFEQLIRAADEEQDTYKDAYARYQAATSEAGRRAAIRVLMDMGGALANELRGPTAGPGSYKLVLTVDGKRYTGSIALRADPMLAPR
jgi:hypothetical protein